MSEPMELEPPAASASAGAPPCASTACPCHARSPNGASLGPCGAWVQAIAGLGALWPAV